MFKFDFNIQPEETDLNADENKFQQNCKSYNQGDVIKCLDSKKITVRIDAISNLDLWKSNFKEMKIGDLNLSYIIPTQSLLRDYSIENSVESTQNADENHTDLIPGIYEGGAKLWECTEDLLQYLVQNYPSDTWKCKKVLDLGCGSGLLGIYAFLCGAQVQFQDYNEDVLNKVTIPNVVLNMDSFLSKEKILEKMSQNIKFYSGDWEKYTEFTKNEDVFDFILTSETIYNPLNQQKLLNTLAAKLSPEGIILVATKTYYFGVGGSVKQFEELIKLNKKFTFKTVWASNNGVRREIMELQWLKFK